MRKFFEQPMVIAFEKNFPEVILDVATVAYGAMLMSPPDSLLYSEGYANITGLMPTWAWGLMFLIAGLFNLLSVLTRRGNFVRSSAKVLFFMWFCLGFLFAGAAFFAPGWILMICLAILYGGVSSEYRTKTKWFDETDDPGPDL